MIGTARRAMIIGLAGLVIASPLASASPARPAAVAGPAASHDASWAGNRSNPYGGRDFYLDASRGNDHNPGTSSTRAWKSLAKASAFTFRPGDRLLLKGGETWSDAQLWPKGSGTERKPIVLDAYGDERKPLPHIATNGHVPDPFTADGTKNPQTVGLTGAVNLRNQEYWSIAHLQVSNDDDIATDITTGRYVRDGISVSINADLFTPGQNTVMRGITIRNIYAHDLDGPSTWQKIYYAGIDFQIFGAKQYGAYAAGGYHFEDIRIEHNSFSHVELNAIQFGFNWWGDQQGQADTAGRWHEGWEQLWLRTRNLYNRDVSIRHNYAESVGQGAYQFAGTKNLTAEYNEANGWLQRYDNVSAGLYLWAGADSVMRYNEVYGGPPAQFDATAWDLEYTNFDVTYEYNYSHDNQGGWMSYMGNSSNSIARYNLSVNDNGVLWKNMLSVNYSPTYVLNNVFVYDGSKLNAFHDEVLKDRVYFANNVFENTSTTTPTTWTLKPGALDNGVFTNNAFHEASGSYPASMPTDPNRVTGDPLFRGDPAGYARSAGVDKILDSASRFQLRRGSPLIDAGRYNPRVGDADFFGTQLYWGKGVDIGIDEVRQGRLVRHPVDTDPIENIGVDPRTDLALHKPAVASSTNPGAGGTLTADKLTDGLLATRWAAADDPAYPVTVDIDFGRPTTFSEVKLSEFVDGGTKPRIGAFDLQRWDGSDWVTFASGTGAGTKGVVNGFGDVTGSKLRLSIKTLQAGETSSPTMTGISVYAS